jgi:predicted site-specific integrase-resolvase
MGEEGNGSPDLRDMTLLTSRQVCRMLGVSRQTLVDWSRSGRINRVRISPGVYKYEEASIYRAMGAQQPRSVGVAVYARESGSGARLRLPGQTRRVRDWCEARGMRVDAEFGDCAPADSWDKHARSGWHELMRLVAKYRVRTVVVEDPGRVGLFAFAVFREVCWIYGTRVLAVHDFASRPEHVADANDELTRTVAGMRRAVGEHETNDEGHDDTCDNTVGGDAGDTAGAAEPGPGEGREVDPVVPDTVQGGAPVGPVLSLPLENF